MTRPSVVEALGVLEGGKDDDEFLALPQAVARTARARAVMTRSVRRRLAVVSTAVSFGPLRRQHMTSPPTTGATTCDILLANTIE